MKTSISIIIPAWNEESIISKTSLYLSKLELPFDYSELIFVAGGTDKTYYVCKNTLLDNFSNVITLKQNSGDFKSGALIKGIKNSKGNIITLMDADTLVAPNFAIEIAHSLKKFNVVNCDYKPLIRKRFWYNYYILRKIFWAKNTSNLTSLFVAATISLKREIINELGIENLFTNKSTAGIDHYMGYILQKNNNKIGIVKNTIVTTPRPNNIKDFVKDQSRWFTAFFQIHEGEKKIIVHSFVMSILFFLIPPLILMFNIYKLRNTSIPKRKFLKSLGILFFAEYILNLIRLNVLIKKVSRRLRNIGHFKGFRYNY